MSRLLLVTDLDNTLWDWVEAFSQAFGALVQGVVEITGLPRAELLQAYRVLHQRHGDIERPFATLELPCVQERLGTTDPVALHAALAPAFSAFAVARAHALRPYPGVVSTLRALQEQGVVVVGHTQSPALNASDRLTRLGLWPHLRRLYALDMPVPPHPTRGRTWSPRHHPKLQLVPPDERKPNPALLRRICTVEGFAPSQALYVGDSLSRDVAMACRAGVCAAWARYGTRHSPHAWALLTAVTHWTEADVAREAANQRAAAGVQAHAVLDSYSDVLPLCEAALRSSNRFTAP